MKLHSALATFAAVIVLAPAAQSATREVRYAPAPAWVLPPPVATIALPASEAPFRVIYTDTQVHAGRDGMEIFTGYRVKLLRPEALPAGNITIDWDPSAGNATVHYLRIIREGQVIDVLKTTQFRVLQREEALEQSMLSGVLTATIQAPGLQVGDEIEFAATTFRRDAALGNAAFGLFQLPMQGLPGAFRFRLLWPEAQPMTWRATKDLPPQTPTAVRGEKQVVYELRDPGSVILTEGAPGRFNVRRVVEFSEFSSWADVSRRVWPLFDKAVELAPNSPIRAEAAKIMAATTDPTARAQAALRLVQEQIRYVYVGLDGGNITPASADETWQRRFGDCKGKTVVLLALLRLMGIAAEPVLVKTAGLEGMNERLPGLGLFNHVLVRARIGAQSYWLDGTRPMDRTLGALPPRDFRWGLPLSAPGSDIEAVPATDWGAPMFIEVLDLDATAGAEAPAKVKVQQIMRGDDAYQIRTQLAGMPAPDADRAVRGYWRQQMDWVEPSEVSWRYDDGRGALILTLAGEGKLEWEDGGSGTLRYIIPGAGFMPPSALKRPKDQDQTAPWLNEFPRFRCWATTIRLPAPGPRLFWDFYADRMNRRLGGNAFWRNAGLRQNVMRTVMSRRSYVPEIGTADVEELNKEIPGFNNNKSQVFLEDKRTPPSADVADGGSLPFTDENDWLNNPSPCSAPAGASIMK